jgi:hypothetical protein
MKENKVGRACGTHRRGEKIVQDFGGKAQRKRPFITCRSEDGIKMDLGETCWEGVEWI